MVHRTFANVVDSEEAREEQDFVNANDPCRPRTIEELEYLVSEDFLYSTSAEDEPSISSLVLGATIDHQKILAIATIAIKHPQILTTLYREGLALDGINKASERMVARRKIFGTIRGAFSAMLGMNSVAEVNRIFADNVAYDGDKETSVLARFAQLARDEMQGHGAEFWTATWILKSLGHSDSDVPYLN